MQVSICLHNNISVKSKMQLPFVLALLFVACLTVLSGYLPCSEAASTERPYQFGFTIEKQQHRQEKKDERGIVMGEFGFITADGIYHVTVYATDEEGKFRILAMRSYPYEEHPKTIDMIVRPKAKPTISKAIAPPTTTTTTTERANPKPIEKHNFSVQGCSGCFLKNNVPTTTTTSTQKPQDKKYEIRTLSRPLGPEKGPQIGKQIIKQILPKVFEDVQRVETSMKQIPLVVEAIGLGIDTRKVGESAVNREATKETRKTESVAQKAQSTTQKAQKAQQVQLTAQGTTPKSQAALQKTQVKQIALHNTPTPTQIQRPTTPLETISTNTNHPNPAFVLNKGSSVPPSNTISSNTAKAATARTFGGANSQKGPGKTGTNALPKSPSAPSAGATGSANGFTTPKKQLTAPAISVGSTGGASRSNTNAGIGGGTPSNGGLSGNAGISKSGGNGSKGGSSGGFASGSKGASAAGETGDLYRFKYNLDYNGHRETGAHNGNKEGSFYAIGDDNVERTIEYIANEFGYQPHVRFRKLDAPVQAKENKLKDYEFVWFKKE